LRLVEFLEKKWALSLDCFHIFLLGGTGSGKSTFLNVIASQEVVAEGVTRPTTERLQVYAHGSLSKTLEELPCEHIAHEDENLIDILIWDLPDMDSYCINHHETSRLLREYADVLFVLMHPEKTRQKSLEEFLSWYPVIPQISWITHSSQVEEKDREQVEAQGWPGSAETFLVDLKSDTQGARKKILEVLDELRSKGLHQWKRETLTELSRQSSAQLLPLLQRTRKDFSRDGSLLASMLDFQKGLNQELEASLWTIYKEKIFGEIREKILSEVLFASRSYFSSFSSLLMKLAGKSTAALELPYLSLPLLRFEEAVPGLNLEVDQREEFLESHRELMLSIRINLLSEARTPSWFYYLLEILLDFLIPPVLLVWVMFHTEPLPSDPLPVLLLLLSFPVLFLLYWGRIQNRIKTVCKNGYAHYQQGLVASLEKLLGRSVNELESSLNEREKHLQRLDGFLKRCEGYLPEKIEIPNS